MANGIPLDHVIARNLRELLDEHEIRYGTLAAWMRAAGCDWTANRVAQTVTLRRSVSFLELGCLCLVLGVPQDRLIAGDDGIEPVPGTDIPIDAIPLPAFRRVLRSGRLTRAPKMGLGWTPERSIVAVDVREEEEPEWARRVGVDLGRLRFLAVQLYGDTHLSIERDRRTGDTSGLSPRSVQAKRGHAMRGILAELREAAEVFEQKGPHEFQDWAAQRKAER